MVYQHDIISAVYLPIRRHQATTGLPVFHKAAGQVPYFIVTRSAVECLEHQLYDDDFVLPKKVRCQKHY